MFAYTTNDSTNISASQIKQLPLSFRTAKDLRGRVELLPAGPKWKFQVLSTPDCPTKSPIRLFYRDPLECLESIFGHPHFAKHIDYTPRRVYKTAEKVVRVYSEWMTGSVAWEMQARLFQASLILRLLRAYVVQ